MEKVPCRQSVDEEKSHMGMLQILQQSAPPEWSIRQVQAQSESVDTWKHYAQQEKSAQTFLS